jgi:hypothetical protein
VFCLTIVIFVFGLVEFGDNFEPSKLPLRVTGLSQCQLEVLVSSESFLAIKYIILSYLLNICLIYDWTIVSNSHWPVSIQISIKKDGF